MYYLEIIEALNANIGRKMSIRDICFEIRQKEKRSVDRISVSRLLRKMWLKQKVMRETTTGNELVYWTEGELGEEWSPDYRKISSNIV